MNKNVELRLSLEIGHESLLREAVRTWKESSIYSLLYIIKTKLKDTLIFNIYFMVDGNKMEKSNISNIISQDLSPLLVAHFCVK